MFWKKKPDKVLTVKHISDYKIGERVEISIFRFSHPFKPANKIELRPIEKNDKNYIKSKK
ncbi:hypothetical protein [Paenibacillus odorifer]|uniref:hypothetical protein n=1 Tax=Paenibacillus odorifer TaxID=189426 RepID=UPI00096EC49F|nr:hypothetical protein [Paenibacillus odorifer]OME19942.1 hypothetical protein BSK57_23525 [Paenibacillus odorifer]